MRETRSSGLEGGVEFKSPSLPLFYRTGPRTGFPLFFGRSFEDASRGISLVTFSPDWQDYTKQSDDCNS